MSEVLRNVVMDLLKSCRQKTSLLWSCACNFKNVLVECQQTSTPSRLCLFMCICMYACSNTCLCSLHSRGSRLSEEECGLRWGLLHLVDTIWSVASFPYTTDMHFHETPGYLHWLSTFLLRALVAYWWFKGFLLGKRKSMWMCSSVSPHGLISRLMSDLVYGRDEHI